MQTLNDFFQEMQPEIEKSLQASVLLASSQGLEEFHEMQAYHMGWVGEGVGPEARGKRIRPMMVLLTASAAGGEWRKALPAAAAVELVHNFSLIHDDIEDSSPLRRGRATLWTRWGIPQAINAGDAMFTIAHLSLLGLAETVSVGVALEANRILQKTCLQLTQGQYLDISYEARGDLSLAAYWPMVGGKTAALLAACTELGALAAQVPEARQAAYRQFGWSLGLAFQAQDDLLGIWGDSTVTGKSADSDLVSGKKSLPVLYGLEQNGPFARRWREGSIRSEQVADLARQLEAEGARQYTQERANALTDQALEALEMAQPEREAGKALKDLAAQLLKRKG